MNNHESEFTKDDGNQRDMNVPPIGVLALSEAKNIQHISDRRGFITPL